MAEQEPWRAGLGAERAVDFHPGREVVLPPELRALIAADLEPLAPLARELPAQLLAFVISGREQGHCLRALGSSREAARAIGLRAFSAGDGARRPPYARAAWLGRCAALDPVLLVRLGAVFGACYWGATRAGTNCYPEEAGWANALLQEASPPEHEEDVPRAGLMDMTQLEAAAVLAGEPPDRFARHYTEHEYRGDLSTQQVHTPGFAQSLIRYPQHVARVLALKGKRLHDALRDFHALSLPPGTWLPRLVELATARLQAARTPARAWLLCAQGEELAAAADALSAPLQGDDPDARAHAAELLGVLAGERSQAVLRAALEREPSPSVRGALAAALASCQGARASSDAQRSAEDMPAVADPPHDPSPSRPLGDEVRVLLERVFDEWYERASAKPEPGREVRSLSAEQRAECWRLLSDPARWPAAPESPFYADQCAAGYYLDESKSVRALLDHPELTAVHLVRCFHLLHGHCELEDFELALRRQRRRSGRAYDLRTVALALEHCAIDPAMIAESALSSGLFRWEPAAVWPYFRAHLDVLDRALGLVRADAYDVRELQALTVLASFPAVPQRYHAVLWRHAMGKNAPLRALAQKCLHGQPTLLAQLVDTLSDPAHEARAAAARWLGALGDARAIEPLRSLLAHETAVGPRARASEALQALGVSGEQLIDRTQLRAEAKRALAKGMPERLAFLDLAALPELRWGDGSKVDGEVVRWWIVLAVRSKDASGNGQLDAYALAVQASGRAAFGQWALDQWLRHDQRIPSTPAELAAGTARLAEKLGREAAEELAPRTPCLDAMAERGLLALASSFGGAALPSAARTYLDRWYGNRMGGCNQLLAMLAWNESPAAIQCLNTIARRFRTATLKRKAGQLVAEIAERNGWTPVELADRSIPDAGLDAQGRLELVYRHAKRDEPSRRFVATLDADFALALADADGRPLKALPKPRKDEDAESAKHASQALTAARKELKPTLAQQTARLFDAMCTQRAFRYAEWDQLLHRHPVMSRVVSRLIWGAARGEQRLWFRPLGDGSLTGARDDAVQLHADDAIRLAHASQMSEDEQRAWSEHIADFELTPPFSQLDRPSFAPGEAALDERELSDFAGHVLTAYTLRRLANQRGYDRKPFEDGVLSHSYRRVFPDIGLSAVLEYTGSAQPETDIPVALTRLWFAAQRPDQVLARRALLRDVPPVLLSECYNDLAEIAAAGTGFDPDWQKLRPW